jgi:hypothetical protein
MTKSRRKNETALSDWDRRGEIRQDVPEGAVFLYTAMIQGVLDGMLLYPAAPRPAIWQQIY